MNRNVYVMLAVMAAVLALAMTVYGTDSSDSATDRQEPIPPFCNEPPVPQFRGPEPLDDMPGPRPMGTPQYFVDASDRRDMSPESIIDEYGRMFEEKQRLEAQGAEFFVYDPSLEEDAGTELANAIVSVMGDSIAPAVPAGAEMISPAQLPQTYSVIFLELLSSYADDGSWLKELLAVMMEQRLCPETVSEGVAPSDSREEDIPAVTVETVPETESGDSEGYVNDVPKPIPSSETYLTEHEFDGGSSF